MNPARNIHLLALRVCIGGLADVRRCNSAPLGSLDFQGVHNPLDAVVSCAHNDRVVTDHGQVAGAARNIGHQFDPLVPGFTRIVGDQYDVTFPFFALVGGGQQMVRFSAMVKDFVLAKESLLPNLCAFSKSARCRYC